MARWYIVRSSYFDRNRYDTRKISRIIKENGGKNVRTSLCYGWSNQPQWLRFRVSIAK